MKIETMGSTFRARYENGLTAIVRERHQVPVVAVQVWVDVGSADEQASEFGLAHLHEHMLFKGTTKRGVGEIAKDIESVGGDINAWTSYDHTVYHTTLASRFEEVALDVLSDAVQHALFDPAELQREKEVILEEIRRSEDMPGKRAGDMLFSLAYRHHPYRHAILGTAESVAGFGRQEIQRFFKKHYAPSRMTVLVVGDVQAKHTMRSIQHFFGQAQAKISKRPKRPVETPQRRLRARILGDEIQEAYFNVGFHIPSIYHQDVPALDLLGIIVGQGESSRISQKLRRELQLVNEAFGYAYTPMDPGLFVIGGITQPQRVLKTLEAIGGEIGRMAHQPVSKQELNKAKGILEHESVYQNETVEGAARRLGFHQVLHDDPHWGKFYLSRVLATTTEDLQRVARRYLNSQTGTIVAFVPAKSLPRLKPAKLKQALLQGANKTTRVVKIKKQEVVNQKLKLKSGLTLMIQADPTNPLLAFRVAFLGGLRYETEANNGINNLMAEMITHGTTSRNAEEMAHALDAMGGGLQGFSGRNSFGLRGKFPSRYFDPVMEIMADCLLNSTFDEHEFSREKKLILEEIRGRQDNLSGLVFDLFSGAMYTSHPYRMPMIGTPQSISRLTRKDLQDFMSAYYTPERMFLAIAGDVEPEQVIQKVEALFKVSPRPPRVFPSILPDPEPTIGRIVSMARDRSQAHVVMGFRGTTLTSQDRFAVEIITALLIGQSGRLFVQLRERSSLAYALTSFGLEGIEPGTISIYLATDPTRLQEAVDETLVQLTRLLKEPISEEEISRAKKYLTGSHMLEIQRLSSRVATMALSEAYGIGYLHYQNYHREIQKVTRSQLRSVLRRYFRLDRMTISLIAPQAYLNIKTPFHLEPCPTSYYSVM